MIPKINLRLRNQEKIFIAILEKYQNLRAINSSKINGLLVKKGLLSTKYKFNVIFVDNIYLICI